MQVLSPYFMQFRRWAFAIALVVAAAPFALAQQPPKLAENDDWELDEVTLDDGKTYLGLIDSDAPGPMTFVEVVRRPGKKMFLCIHRFEPGEVVAQKRIDKQARKETVSRLQPLLTHRSRERIEARRMERIELSTETRDDGQRRAYSGEWFEMESTSDEETTRRSIVRLEQVFLAYSRVLPPRKKPSRPLRVLLFGGTAEYAEHLQKANLAIRNPAYFSAEENRIVAGNNLTLFGRQLSQATAANQSALDQYLAQAADFDKQLNRYSRQRRQAGVGDEQIRDEVVALRKKFNDELDDLRKQIAASERANTRKFDEYAAKMFARLRHEAFHAYVENYIYGHDDPRRRIDRWLNEGLAQVFEAAQLDADTLRIDAPDAEKLALLQADMRSSPLRLSDLLAADSALFLSTHPGGEKASERHYLYSWGLVYYLMFGPRGLDNEAIDQLCLGQAPSAERLQQWTGKSIAELQREWIDWMTNLPPGR